MSRFAPDLRAPGTFNMDFSMFKHFKFRERLDAQIRMEAFNFFNHPTWATPGLAVNAPGTFGVITPGQRQSDDASGDENQLLKKFSGIINSDTTPADPATKDRRELCI